MTDVEKPREKSQPSSIPADPSPTPVRVLILEDREPDAELMLHELRKSGFEPKWQRVETEPDFLAAVESEPDLILADWSLPQFSGLRALQLTKTSNTDVPFVIVSGKIGEETAVDALKQGADDYVWKDRMARLGPAVRRALADRQLLREGQQVQQALQESQERYRLLVETSPDGILMSDLQANVILANPKAAELWGGKDPANLLGKNAIAFIAPQEHEKLFHNIQRTIEAGLTRDVEYTFVRVDGSSFPGELTASTVLGPEGTPIGFMAIVRDISERKQSLRALEESEGRYRSLVEQSGAGVGTVDLSGNFTFVNSTLCTMLGYEQEELVGKPFASFLHPDDVAPLVELFAGAFKDPAKDLRLEFRAMRKDGTPVHCYSNPRTIYRGGEIAGFSAVILDVTERKQLGREREAVAVISQALRAADTRAEMLPILLDQVMALLNAAGSCLALRDPATNETIFELARGELAKTSGTRLAVGEGMTGRVIQTGQPYLTGDFRSDPLVARPQLVGDIRAMACVPLIAQGTTLGTLVVGRQLEFAPYDVQTLTAIADIAANAIRRTTLHEQTQRRLNHVIALSEIDRAILSGFDMRPTLSILLIHVAAQLGVDAADVLLFNSSQQRLEFLAGRGFRTKGIERIRMRLGEGYAGQAAMSRQMLSIPDVKAQPGDSFLTVHLSDEHFNSYGGVPLIAKGELKGVLEVYKRTPFAPDQEWLDLLTSMAESAAIAIDNSALFDRLQRSNTDLMLSYEATIEGWSRAMDLRDKETEGHTQRVTELSERVATALGISGEALVHVRHGALLHDIGKMGVPDAILFKPGPLTDEEWVIMRKHPEFAYEMLSPIPFLRPAVDIPYCHHEKWDGTGYPRGLAGEEIPLAARAFAIVDVWDALRSDRPYRPGWPEEKTIQHIREQSGKHFEPRVVEAFLQVLTEKGGDRR